ncbi:uncharacterized protein LOC143236827 [Tachypleus tridentatus]|uniref:uncharacterized protein LOC143236827 n=1 Tax=Tachypleus tridentatus TaxID=6853 RepID=UPI003FD0847E
MNWLFCLFLQSAIPLFEQANLMLQREEPCIHIMHRTLITQVKNILVRYIKPEYLLGNITELDYNNETLHKSDEAVSIGNAAKEYIVKYEKDLDLISFYTSVKKYYIAATNYMMKHFSLNDELVIHAEVADPKLKVSKDFSSLCFFTDRYPVLVNTHEHNTIDKLEGQYLNYQIDTFSETVLQLNVDKFWVQLSTVKDGNGNQKYDILCRVMLGILTIFHSNADSERIFSLVTKNKSKFRPNLSISVLSSITTHKMCMQSNGQCYYNSQPSRDILMKAKAATAAKLLQ